MPREGTVYVVGTCDTKGEELAFVKARIQSAGVPVWLVDLSTCAGGKVADVSPGEVAAYHPGGSNAVLTSDRGRSVAAMAEAFQHWIEARDDVAGIVGLGGSGGTALATPAMRALPVGVPKLMVSTVASGNVSAYVGPSDICMMYSVTDLAGLNRISRVILANAANAMIGMVRGTVPAASANEKPALGLTMFGVTTLCVNRIVELMRDRYDCLVFHATGTGGQSMEKLADSGLVAGMIDVTTTEVCDLLLGGALPATEDRFGAVARSKLPYVGSCGALDMVNFGAPGTVPERYRERNLYAHNPQVTLMRTTPEENTLIGRWIGEKLNACDGEVRFLIPEKGVSLLDAPGMAFHNPAADAALFEALEATVQTTDKRQLRRLPCNINDDAFAAALAAEFRAVAKEA